MAEELRIPKIGMSATEMTLNEWMVGDGERVEVEAQIAGTIRPTGVEGQVYPVGALVGTIE